MPAVKITDGARVVTVEETQERRPSPPRGMQTLPTVTGDVVVYETVGRLREEAVAGRVKTREEVDFLEAFVAEGTQLYLIDRDGTTTAGWRIKTDPLPTIRRKDGDSVDWLITLTLWRAP